MVLEKSSEDDWWKAKKKTSSEEEEEPEGLIPNNYVEEVSCRHPRVPVDQTSLRDCHDGLDLLLDGILELVYGN